MPRICANSFDKCCQRTFLGGACFIMPHPYKMNQVTGQTTAWWHLLHERVNQIVAEIRIHSFWSDNWSDEMRGIIPFGGRFWMRPRDANLPISVGCNQRRNLAVGVCRKHNHIGRAIIKEKVRAILKVHGAWLLPPVDVHDGIRL